MHKVLAWISLIATIVGTITSFPLSAIDQGFETWMREAIALFSFFTVLSNTIVGLCAFALISESKSPFLLFFTKRTTLTAACLYIIITGLIHHFILSAGAPPYQGVYVIANFLHHYLNPVLAPILWITLHKSQVIQFKKVLWWLIFPLSYLAYWLIRGPIIGYYPYGFIDVNLIGYQWVAINSVGLTVIFGVLGCALIGVDKLVSRLKA